MSLRSRWTLLRALLLAGLAPLSCGPSSERIHPTLDETNSDASVAVDARPLQIPLPQAPAWFADRAKASGVDFERTLAEYDTLQGRMSGGVCLLDVDLDGRIDLFFPGESSGRSSGPHLYLARPTADAPLHYVDETAARGLSAIGDARGCLAFDLEGDGDIDLLTTGFGGARLFRNDGGVFVDVSARLGNPIAPDIVATSSVAFDADGDGDLDLAIGTFGRYVPSGPPGLCEDSCLASVPDYHFGGTYLLLQHDDGTFEDATDRIGHPDEPVLVLLATDFDDDGSIDLFVGNDTALWADHYFHNDGTGHFGDLGKEMGIAFSKSKSGISSMSANDGDIDGDGRLDLVESSLDAEPSVVFRCGLVGEAKPCRDVSDELELFRMPPNYRWGQVIADFDDDGVNELFEATGHYFHRTRADGSEDPTFLTKDISLLWWHDDGSRPFVRQLSDGGLAVKTGGRGVAVGDLDGDGDLDLVVGTALGHPVVLENVHARRGHHLFVDLAGAGKNPHGVGAKVMVHSGVRTWTVMAHAGSGFMSTSAPRLHFGVGDSSKVSVDVRWASGKRSHVDGVGVDAVVSIKE